MQSLSESDISGLMQVRQNHYTGCIYLSSGYVTHAQATNSHGVSEEGYHALLRLLGLQDALYDWVNDAFPASETMHIPLKDALQAQTELTQENTISHIERDKDQSTDLNNYSVSVVIERGSMEGSTYTISKDVTKIGRAQDCEIILPDSTISSHHCDIICKDDHLKIVDRDSFNGTKVNGHRVKEIALYPNDQVQVGIITMVINYSIKEQSNDPKPQLLTPAVSASFSETPTAKIPCVTPEQRFTPISWETVSSDKTRKRGLSNLISNIFKG